MREYIVTYRTKRNKQGLLHQALIVANDVWEARALARTDLSNNYTILTVKPNK